jgi:peptide deformylase
MLLTIRYYGDPMLRKKGQRVAEITEEIRSLVASMTETMEHYNGIGLAAPQVGRDLSLFILRDYMIDEQGRFLGIAPEVKVFINPELCFVSKQTDVDEEGCLSVPKLKADVERPYSIIIEATNLLGERFREELSGYNARVRLHENDHINGTLFVDRLSPREKKRVEPLLRALKKRCAS